ncbi:MAG: lactate utilization protein [Chloroflexi bacterium]|nr:lactate utilization protein [Chloroflexota bacterium]
MTDRAKFIAGITSDLGRTEMLVPSADLATAIFEDAEVARTRATHAVSDASSRSSDLVEHMAESAITSGWKVHRVANPEDAAELIGEICRQKEAKTVLRSTHDVLSTIPLEAAITSFGATLGVTALGDDASSTDRDKARESLFGAEVGITGVDFAIAETGTVVLHPRKGLSRLLSLAPPTHVAVMRPGDVLDSLDELFAMERDDFLSGELAGSMNLISGPSKTADIEGTIVTGIHGPLEVHLVILANS